MLPTVVVTPEGSYIEGNQVEVDLDSTFFEDNALDMTSSTLGQFGSNLDTMLRRVNAPQLLRVANATPLKYLLDGASLYKDVRANNWVSAGETAVGIAAGATAGFLLAATALNPFSLLGFGLFALGNFLANYAAKEAYNANLNTIQNAIQSMGAPVNQTSGFVQSPLAINPEASILGKGSIAQPVSSLQVLRTEIAGFADNTGLQINDSVNSANQTLQNNPLSMSNHVSRLNGPLTSNIETLSFVSLIGSLSTGADIVEGINIGEALRLGIQPTGALQTISLSNVLDTTRSHFLQNGVNSLVDLNLHDLLTQLQTNNSSIGITNALDTAAIGRNILSVDTTEMGPTLASSLNINTTSLYRFNESPALGSVNTNQTIIDRLQIIEKVTGQFYMGSEIGWIDQANLSAPEVQSIQIDPIAIGEINASFNSLINSVQSRLIESSAGQTNPANLIDVMVSPEAVTLDTTRLNNFLIESAKNQPTAFIEAMRSLQTLTQGNIAALDLGPLQTALPTLLANAQMAIQLGMLSSGAIAIPSNVESQVFKLKVGVLNPLEMNVPEIKAAMNFPTTSTGLLSGFELRTGSENLLVNWSAASSFRSFQERHIASNPNVELHYVDLSTGTAVQASGKLVDRISAVEKIYGIEFLGTGLDGNLNTVDNRLEIRLSTADIQKINTLYDQALNTIQSQVSGAILGSALLSGSQLQVNSTGIGVNQTNFNSNLQNLLTQSPGQTVGALMEAVINPEFPMRSHLLEGMHSILQNPQNEILLAQNIQPILGEVAIALARLEASINTLSTNTVFLNPVGDIASIINMMQSITNTSKLLSLISDRLTATTTSVGISAETQQSLTNSQNTLRNYSQMLTSRVNNLASALQSLSTQNTLNTSAPWLPTLATTLLQINPVLLNLDRVIQSTNHLVEIPTITVNPTIKVPEVATNPVTVKPVDPFGGWGGFTPRNFT